jgi:hypothetical protein
MPRKYDPQEPTTYSRLVTYLQRLWDYEACDEAALKIWLAHHLLARENTGLCRVFGGGGDGDDGWWWGGGG